MNKRILLLVPLLPLSAIGIVEVASHIMPPTSEPAAVHHVRRVVEPPAPPPVVKFSKPHFAPVPTVPAMPLGTGVG